MDPVTQRRRAPSAPKSAAQIVDHLLLRANSPHVVVGPLVWQPSDGTSGRRWYFTVATSERRRGFRCDHINVDPEPELDRMRIMAEIATRRPTVIHDVGDELAMARLCELLWPGDRITGLRQDLEAEYARRSP